MVSIVSLKNIIGQSSSVVWQTLVDDFHQLLWQGQRNHTLVVSMPGLEINPTIDHLQDASESCTLEEKTGNLDFGPFVWSIFSEEKIDFTAFEKRHRIIIIDKFQFFPEATLQRFDIDPSLIIDSKLSFFDLFFHEGIVGFWLFEAALKFEHVFNKMLALPFRTYHSKRYCLYDLYVI